MESMNGPNGSSGRSPGEAGHGGSASAPVGPEIGASWDGLWTLDDEWHPAAVVDAWRAATDLPRLVTLDVAPPVL
jgi:hypothetical protein